MMTDNKKKEKKNDEGALLNNLKMFSLWVRKTSQWPSKIIQRKKSLDEELKKEQHLYLWVTKNIFLLTIRFGDI